MERKHKALIKINLLTIIMVVISFGSVTFAWFAYSGIASVATEVDVKAWYIEMEQDGSVVTNHINISFDDIYPGMDTVTETITVNNLGDADAILRHYITSARVLDKPEDSYTAVDDLDKSEEIEDILAHDYPFHVNITTDEEVAVARTGSINFNVSISWPLDAGHDDIDSYWGNQAYYFNNAENALLVADPTYQVRPSIELELELIAEQSIGNTSEIDLDYQQGTLILFNPVTNSACLNTNLSNCYTTFVMDSKNMVGDTTVTLFPSFSESFSSGNYTSHAGLIANKTSQWTSGKSALMGETILRTVSSQGDSAYLTRPGLSDVTIGNVQYEDRATTELQEGIDGVGTYYFNDNDFLYLHSATCYWTGTSINDTYAYALKTVSGNTTMYPELKTRSCIAVPIMIVDKTKLG